MASTEDIISKYSKKIEETLQSSTESSSQDYSKFKSEMIHIPTRYERWAKSVGNTVTLKVAEKDRVRIEKNLQSAHVEVTPSQAMALSLLSALIVFMITVIASISLYLINDEFAVSVVSLFVLGMIATAFVFYYTYTMPQRLANEWRLRASSQMVPAILYVVIYMKHTSNLERAIAFAAEHLEGPLSLDFKKVFYDVEIGKYTTMKQSLDGYLETWKDYAPEFVESFHLIESSLYEPTEGRRIEILEKSLQIVLDGVYEKMLKFSRDIRSPMTNIYMLGIILPTLALALLPLASTLLGDMIQWQHIVIIFDLIIPFLVFYMASEVLMKRPGGYGESSILELNPDYAKYTSSRPWKKAFFIALPLILIGLLPFIMQVSFITESLGLKNDYTFSDLGINTESIAKAYIFDFKDKAGHLVGPFGTIGIMLSMFIPLGIALFFAIAYKNKTSELIKSREKTKQLEEEFNNSIFQLGNRLGDGIPAEIAFAKVSESTKGQVSQNFFSIVNMNIQQAGMSIDQAIFDKKRGAIIYYPSSLIATSMKILVESAKKGLQVAARSLMSISDYVKNIQKINQRVRDLLAEIVSDMKSNMVFLAPMLSGIVVGLSAMITLILNKLSNYSESLSTDLGSGLSLGSINGIMDLFKLTYMVPPYFVQLTIGIYMIEVTFILTAALVTIDAGKDTLKEKSELAKNLKRGILLYIIVAFFSTLFLSILAASVLKTI